MKPFVYRPEDAHKMKNPIEIEIKLAFPTLGMTVESEHVESILEGLKLGNEFRMKQAISGMEIDDENISAEMSVNNVITLLELYATSSYIQDAEYEINIGGKNHLQYEFESMRGD